MRYLGAILLLVFQSAGASAQQNWQPTQEMMERAVAVNDTFWGHVDSGNYDAAYAMFDAYLASQITHTQFRDLAHDIVDATGPVTARNAVKVTWYRRPGPDGQLTSFAALDFTAAAQNVEIYCGYLVIHFPDDGATGVMRFEQNYVENQVASGMTAEQRRQVAAAYNCQE